MMLLIDVGTIKALIITQTVVMFLGIPIRLTCRSITREALILILHVWMIPLQSVRGTIEFPATIICIVQISKVAQVCSIWFHQAMNYGKGWHNFEDLREGREFQGGGVIATASASNLEMVASFVYKHGSDACDFQGTIH